VHFAVSGEVSFDLISHSAVGLCKFGADSRVAPNVTLRPKQNDWVTINDTSDKRQKSVALRPRLIMLKSRYAQTLA
jgi:hypothetical protein